MPDTAATPFLEETTKFRQMTGLDDEVTHLFGMVGEQGEGGAEVGLGKPSAVGERADELNRPAEDVTKWCPELHLWVVGVLDHDAATIAYEV